MRKPKLTDAQRENIRQAFEKEKAPFAALAAQYGVSYNTIKRICKPDKYKEQLESNANYRERNKEKIVNSYNRTYTRYYIQLHKTNDASLISKLEEQENVTGYIKNLIIKDIESESKNN